MGAELNGENGTVDIINVTEHDDLTVNGKKTNIHRYKMVVAVDDQDVFTIPFIYREGDDIEIEYDTVKYQRGFDFTIIGNQLTLGSSIPATDAGDKIYVIG